MVSFIREPAACDLEGSEEEAISKGGDGDARVGGEGDVKEGGVGQNGSFRGKSRWSQVVARVRLAAEKRFHSLPKIDLLNVVKYLQPCASFILKL